MSRHATEGRRECRWTQRQLAEYVSGELSAAKAERCRRHLQRCEVCREELERLTKALRLLRAAGQIEPPADAVERVLASLGAEPDPLVIARHRQVFRLATAGAAASLLCGLFIVAALITRAPTGSGLPMSASQPEHATGVQPGPALPVDASRSAVGTIGEVGRKDSSRIAGGVPRTENTGTGGVSPSASARGAAERHPSRAPEPRTDASNRGQPSTRPVAIKRGATGPGPAQEAVPLALAPPSPSALAQESPTSAEKLAPPERVETGPKAAAARREAASARERAPAIAGSPAEASHGTAELPPRPMTLGGAGASGGEAGRWAVSDQFWQIRVDVPRAVVAGSASAIGVVILGRASLAGVQLRVRAESGAWLGDAVEIPLVSEAKRVEASVPFRVDGEGVHRAALVVRAEAPAVLTDIPIELRVIKAESSGSQGLVSAVLREVPLRRAAEALGRQAGVMVDVPDTIGNVAVDADFSTPTPIEAALRILAEQVGASLERTDLGFRFVTKASEADEHVR
ncbi:MAG: zf-HC2 domain-containing protein [Armatimonadetes bacterium]|nr:zf-HC2 domain-containing protein [Armatimonadota bacterium]